MPQIKRNMLEQFHSLRNAKAFLTSFCNDRETYPDSDVHLRKGICKILIEEYGPLVRLAKEQFLVRDLRLFPEANQGPDGEIRFWFRGPFRIQIVCSNQGYNRVLMREILSNGCAVFPNQNRQRDKSTRKVVSSGRVLTTSTADIEMRVQRILNKIDAKEKKYYPDTDTLLIQEDPAGFRHLMEGGLHQMVCDSIQKRQIQYKQIFINYGNTLKRAK
ncbi:MAG: hypothetical protein ACQETR_09575 [Thermodesulfobacteriota bacterium]